MTFEKLLNLGPRLFKEKAKDLALVQKDIGPVATSSKIYRELLAFIGGAIIFDKGAMFTCDESSPLNDRNGNQRLEVLFGFGDSDYSIKKEALRYADQLPPSFGPIGESPGGNLVCVNGDGVVYLWDHESQYEQGIWRIAGSIDEFLNRLSPENPVIGDTENVIESKSFLNF